MNAATQYRLSADDLGTVLAVVRGTTLAQAGTRLGQDASTVFRAVQRIEKGLGERLFERARSGYRPTALALRLVGFAESIESELHNARAAAVSAGTAAGVVRISAVDAVLNGLVAPVLPALMSRQPQLRLELHASNELTSLTWRDADVVLRSTARPPSHAVGRRLGTMRFAVYASQRLAGRLLKGRPTLGLERVAALPWIAVDRALPEHPGVLWRRRVLPAVQPAVHANSMVTAADAIEAGLGVGVVARFHARRRPQLAPLTAPLQDCTIDLWLLTHPESRHLQRIAVVARHLAQHVALDE